VDRFWEYDRISASGITGLRELSEHTTARSWLAQPSSITVFMDLIVPTRRQSRMRIRLR
jgi:hypothetical protein